MKMSSSVVAMMVLAALCVSALGENKQAAELLPKMAKDDRKLMTDYEWALEFSSGLTNPDQALAKRRAWNREGFRCTTELLKGLRKRPEEDAAQVVILLGGTHDDRAALGLLELLETNPPPRVRWATYAALAELSYYTDYHARLLLQIAAEGRREKTGLKTWHSALYLATIHHPEAIWAQSQLHERRLIDGALSGQVGPLLALRDKALGLR